ncbi:unnamed protein product [Lathyrus oleraceus]
MVSQPTERFYKWFSEEYEGEEDSLKNIHYGVFGLVLVTSDHETNGIMHHSNGP